MGSSTRGAVSAAFAAAACTLACGQISGVDDYRSGADDADLGCEACLEAQCQGEIEACRSDPTCSAALGCDLECAKGDRECESRCIGRFAAGFGGSEPWSLLSCRAARCDAAC